MRAPPDLLALQRDFLAALYGEGNAAPASIRGSGLVPDARLDIYRHASELIHLGALATSYPAARALVGEAYFGRVAMAYRRAFPSRSGNLQAFGEAFPAFLAGRPETVRWPYLGDVARLEWLRQSSALAADAVPLDGPGFEAGLAAATRDVTFHLDPSLRLLSSRHPVAAIWRYAVSEGAGACPDADGPGEHVALWREGTDVVVSTLQPASFACLQALATGRSLSRAHGQACDIDPGFDLVAFVGDLVRAGRVVRLESADRESDAPARHAGAGPAATVDRG
ncbi:MAG: putative DNA-binding domain-containing protein [Xanthomonadaceae bacterium]|nr:putative DNA-binding domain-containing protein [Xanthomonadaceae bacterium]MDE1964718.1 putative DNA-binding domain-containing protein [Xanthomonadaceae bacterium]